MSDGSPGGGISPPIGNDVRVPADLAQFAQVARSLTSALRVGDVMQRVVEHALHLARARAAFVERVVSANGTVRVEAALGEGAPAVGTEVPYPGSLTEEIIESAGPVALATIEEIGRSIAPHLAERCDGCSALVVPLRMEGEVMGCLVLLREPRSEPFDDLDLLHSRVLGDLTSLSLRRALLLEVAEREQRERTALLNSSGEGIFGTDLDGRCTFMNPAAARMLGYTPEECLGRNMHQLIHHRRADGSAYPEEECPIHATYHLGRPIRSDDEVLWRKDGSCFHAQYGAAPVVDHGEIRGAVVSFRDVSDPRRAEEALRRSEERYRTLADLSADAIVLLDSESTILSANPALERIFGYPAEELVGHSFVRLIPERLRESHRAGMRRYMETGERHIPWTGIQLPGLRRDGSEVPLEVSFAEYEEEGARVFAGFMRDITERVRAEEERSRTLAREQEARAEAERAVRIRDEVLGIVSHDLRNPLHTIMMSTSNLLELPLPEEQRTNQLEIIQRSAQRMSRLIQDLLDVARLESGHFSIELQPADPQPIVREGCEALRPLAEGKRQLFECHFSEDLPQIGADRDRLHQVIGNLVGNAIKFTDEGGSIRVVLEPTAEGVRFAVSDTGPGIADEELPHLFDPYWQARETAHLGAGLGLPISRGIVEAHGGTIGVESRQGVGSTFYFVIPRWEE